MAKPFRILSEKIDADPERRARVEKLKAEFEAYLEQPEEECECSYPHYNDYDPYNFELCTCASSCYHIGGSWWDHVLSSC